MTFRADDLEVLYRARFGAADRARRSAVWRSLCRGFFQRYVAGDAVVVDVGAGDALFCRHIRAARRIAVDVVLDEALLHEQGIEPVVCAATELGSRLAGVADVVFMSNFLEHLESRALVVDVLRSCAQALKPGGRLLVLQPNARYAGAAYWDFLDHHIALTDRTVVEAIEVVGLHVEEVIPRFLPYTSKSPLAHFSALVPLYVRLPLLWRFFGAQSFIAARRLPDGARRVP